MISGQSRRLAGDSSSALCGSPHKADYVDASIMLSRHGRRAPTARLGRQAQILIST